MARILIVEDNADLAFGVRNNLEIEGHVVELAGDGRAGLAMASAPFDLIILDLMMPAVDGFRVLQTLRGRGDHTPILILTARGQEEDKVRGLKLGADDYVTKPFGVLELMARVEALLRRVRPAVAQGAVRRFGQVEVDPSRRSVRVRGIPVALTPKEFDLLWALLEADGTVVRRDELMVRVWGYQADVLSRTVDTHVADLRRKLGSGPGAPAPIVTVRKVGYRLDR